MGFFNYPSWLTIEIKLVPRIDMRRLELKYIFSKLIVYITLFACNLIDTYTQGKFPKNKFINFYMQTPKKIDNKSKYLFDNLQGETGDRGPFGNQGPRGYPVSLSSKEYSVLINNGNVCCISVYLRHLVFWKMRPEAPYVINIFFS